MQWPIHGAQTSLLHAARSSKSHNLMTFFNQFDSMTNLFTPNVDVINKPVFEYLEKVVDSSQYSQVIQKTTASDFHK